MNAELLAVTKMIELIAECPHLAPYFDSNDKTPLTDGHIDIHSSEEQSKKNFCGRVPVQIKGRQVSKKMTTFPISKDDLDGHLKDSGVLYFVVNIDKSSRQRRTYYAMLTPFTITRILQDMAPGQKSHSVKLRKLPSEPASIERIVKLAYQTRSESPFSGVDPTLFEHIESFTLHADRELDLDAPILLRTSELDYSLVITTRGGMSVPVDWEVDIMPASYVGERIDVVVSSGGHCFRNPVRKRIDKETVDLVLSEGLKIRFQEPIGSKTAAMSLTLRNGLADRRADIGFLLACLDDSGFSIDDQKVAHVADDFPDDDELRNHYEYLDRLHELLSELHVDVDLVSVKDITPKESDQLVGLHRILVQKQESAQDNDGPGRVLQPIGPWGLELICLQGSSEGNWKCVDLFDPALGQQFAMTEESEPGIFDSFLVTPYETLDEQSIPYTLNLNLPRIVDAYAALPETPKTFTLANHMVLKLLKAGDKVGARRQEFLDAAEALNDWLIQEDGGKAYHLINRWQIVARVESLSDEDRQEIRSLRRAATRGEVEHPALAETSCSILLEDDEEVRIGLTELDDAQLQAIRAWPIWSLWESGDSSTSE
jgi:hypothetical protein